MISSWFTLLTLSLTIDSNTAITAIASTASSLGAIMATPSSTYEEDATQFLMEYNQMQNQLDQQMPTTTIVAAARPPKVTQLRFHRDVQSTPAASDENFTPTTKAYFVDLCTNFLLSDDTLEDEKITNKEAALFIEYLCDVLQVPSCQNTSIKFYNLPLLMQLAFVNSICRKDTEVNSTVDKTCVNRLREEVDEGNEFGLPVDVDSEENMNQVEDDIEEYCSDIYALSSKYHFGTYEPSPAPSSVPTPALPEPDATYTTTFTYMMGFDDAAVAQRIVDNGGEDVMTSTASAIVKVLTSPESLLNAIIKTRNLLRGTDSYVDVQVDVDLNVNVDAIDEVYNPNHRDLEFTMQSSNGNNGVEHKIKKEATCTDAFVSTNCVLVVSEVTLKSDVISTKDTVNDKIYRTMKNSMKDSAFRDLVNKDEVKEVFYISDGTNIDFAPTPTPTDRGVGGGSVAGITIGSVLFLVLLAFFVGRTRAKDDDRVVLDEDRLGSDSDEYRNEDESDDESSDAAYIMSTEVNKKNTNNTRELPSINENENKNDNNVETEDLKPRGLQFDPVSGQVLGSAAMSYASSYNSVSSGYSADGPETPSRTGEKGDVLIDRLDTAVHAGDWAAVAAIAGDLSQADDISTMSSYHSRAGDISFDPSETEILSPNDIKRASKIDKLIAEGDWNAVGATAAAFHSEGGSMSSGSQYSTANSKSSLTKTESQPNKVKGRSILDFISGPWQSTAAAKAIEKEDEKENSVVEVSDPEEPFATFPPGTDTDDDEFKTDDEVEIAPFSNLNANEDNSTSEPSDLSAGEAILSRAQTGPVGGGVAALVGLGTVGIAGATAAAVYHSESETTTDDDTKQLVAAQKKKRSWVGRFTRKKSKEEEEQAGTSLALQEDSSVSSWSRGEDSSPDITLNHLYGSSSQQSDDMPPEMKAFGEDHGLAVAERAMEEEEQQQQQQSSEEDKKEDSESEISQKSSSSLRDELDKAIEAGDWAALEKQTSEMLEVTTDDDGNLSPQHRGLSDIESDVDTDDIDGWSNGNQSDNESELIDDERIEMLEKLIETDDWQGIVDNSQIHTKPDDSVVDDDTDSPRA